MRGGELVISVLLVDDQALIRQAFAALLELESDLTVVGQAADAAIAVELVAARQPDVVLMDVQLAADGGEDGLSATAASRRPDPETRVIVLTTFGRPGYLRRAMEAGAVGFLVKDAPADRLVEAIRRVHRGLRVVDPALAAASLSIGTSPLTDRETEVLAAAAGGETTSAIAASVFLIRRHRPEPPVGGHGQARRRLARRGRPDRHRQRLVVLSRPSAHRDQEPDFG